MTQYTNNFDYIKLRLASPSRIFQWANRKLPNGQVVGEVQTSETINYRTFKPEMRGLFCERIFGPSNSFTCYCEKYRQVRYEGLICERCGVELTDSIARRYRMGYIRLIYPVVHIWYITSRPNYMALLLEVEQAEKKLTKNIIQKGSPVPVLNPKEQKKKWIVEKKELIEQKQDDEQVKRIKLASLAYFIAENETDLYGLHWDLQQYRRAREYNKTNYVDKRCLLPEEVKNNVPKMLLRATPGHMLGAALIQRELERLNLKNEIQKTRLFMLDCTTVLEQESHVISNGNLYWTQKWEQQRTYKLRDQSIKRIRLLENLVGTQASPAWMIFNLLPVIPPALRPILQLEGGRFATTDLNELYRRVLIRNIRLRKLLEAGSPRGVLRCEKRLLQEAVDCLLENGKRGRVAMTTTNNRPLKCLSDIIKGKYGRFRLNLLGKRVDYSGRSVIVVGPSLKLNQCGLPYEMALELFQPFIIRELIRQDVAGNIKSAQNLIQKQDPILEDVLKTVCKNHPIFLNRAPTLHRLGVQAFEPILVRGRAIKLHPLVCSAFNADFDGDQMAVHIPLSVKAQSECYMLMMAPYNFLSSANGEPIIVPSQDMVLGCYYLTLTNLPKLLGSNHYFADLKEVMFAYSQKKIDLHSNIWVRMTDELLSPTVLIKSILLKDQSVIEYYEDKQVRKTSQGEILVQYMKTTTGRVILNSVIQNSFTLL